jgi:hypothetical protein
MPTPPLSDELAREALAAFQHHGSKSLAANALGLNRKTLSNRLTVAYARGFHLSDGARGVISQAGLSGSEARGGWLHSYDSDGKKVGATYWKAPEISAADFIDQIKDAFADITPAPLIPAPMHKAKDLVTVYPIADAHIGMMAWGKETGEDYDTKAAVTRLQSWIGACIAASPPSETALILDVGDLTHADDYTSQTPRSKHVLDTDTRHFKTLDMTIHGMNTAVDLALRKHKRVIVRILPGNHDPHAYLAIMFAMAERWRENPRVEVQKIPGEFYVERFGSVLIAAHHGDKAKAERLVLFLADEYPELWGATRQRYLFTAHLHHHKSADIGGVQWEQLRAMTARDAHSVAHAYSARAQLQAITYHISKGEVSRVKVGA